MLNAINDYGGNKMAGAEEENREILMELQSTETLRCDLCRQIITDDRVYLNIWRGNEVRSVLCRKCRNGHDEKE